MHSNQPSTSSYCVDVVGWKFFVSLPRLINLSNNQMNYIRTAFIRLVLGYAIFVVVCLLGIVSFEVFERWQLHAAFVGIVVANMAWRYMVRSSLRLDSTPEEGA